MVPQGGRPTICLNMIARNEAHVIKECLDAVAPYIDYWVIVDTGSDDGTQDIIRDHMQRLGIPGEVHERPWRNFGHNRSEALKLAQGHCEYIWVMDADDTVEGTIDFRGLGNDAYLMRIDDGVVYWRLQLLRDGMPWYYTGVLHELAACEQNFQQERLEGEYRILSRRIGGRNLDPHKYLRDAEILLAEVERNPDDRRSVFYLAQSYYCYGDFVNSRKWDERRAEMGGWEEEVYYSKFRAAEAMARSGAPWPETVNAYLQAWVYRPVRAEALHALARHYRVDQNYLLGHLFAKRAAELPLPDDALFVNAEVHAWRALDEQAVCASWIGMPAEAFAVSRRLLNRDDIPDQDRQRIAANRDLMAPRLIDAATAYPERLPRRFSDGRTPEVTATVVAGPDRSATERSLNSFIHCCTDVDRIDRFLVLDVGLSDSDRAVLEQRYPFADFLSGNLGADGGDLLAQLRPHITGQYWLHLGAGWLFFGEESFVSRLTGVLQAEPEVFQVGINFEDAHYLSGRNATGNGSVRRDRDNRRYVLTDAALDGPAMFDAGRLDRVNGGWKPGDTLHTATLDEVLCVVAAQ